MSAQLAPQWTARATAASRVCWAASLTAAAWVVAVSASVRSRSVRSIRVSPYGDATMPASMCRQASSVRSKVGVGSQSAGGASWGFCRSR